jgi:membrane protease YdiL (CAAX protease family)
MSRRAELMFINLICFGPFAARSILGLVEHKDALTFGDREALIVIGIEIVCGVAAVLLLRARGWSFAAFGLRPTMTQTVSGMLLLIGTYIFVGSFALVVSSMTHTNLDAVVTSHAAVSLPVLLVLTLINPLYDELFLVAYNLEAARDAGAFFAITLSTFIRFVCALDNGPIAVVMLPLGLIFAAVYWRWRALWPLVVAHAVMDFMGYVSELR